MGSEQPAVQAAVAPSEAEAHRLRAIEHALHFHALRELHPAWAAAEPRRFPKALRPMGLEEAVDSLDEDDHRSVQYRIAVAKLAHAATVSGKPELHAHLDRALSKLPDAGASVKGLVGTLTPQDAFKTVEHAVRLASGDSGCAYEGPDAVLQLDSQYGWARVEREVTVNRDISQFVGAGDPRKWHEVAPETFAESTEQPGGTPTDFLLLEHARWSPNGTVISNYRNLIQIHYEAPATGGMSLRYALHKSIQTDVEPLYAGRGGLSIDSGEARIYEPPGRPGFTTIMASKKLRHVFPNDDTVAIVLNYLSLPAIAVLMDRFVVGGACP